MRFSPALFDPPLGMLEVFTAAVGGLCALAIILSITINFIEARQSGITREKRSVVATFSMSCFFVVLYFLLRYRVGVFSLPDPRFRSVITVLGLAVMVLGCAINIRGRLNLKDNWANQIRIYKDHSLVRRGVYAFVRHPLYASLIWIFIAASLVYLNWAAMLLTVCVFIPFMYYRAKQEEHLLSERFPEYADYRQAVGMFFPKVRTLWNLRMNR